MQYYVTGRYLQTTEGIENPLPTLNAIHDFSQQERGFAYMSSFIDPYTRVSLIAGSSTSSFQIPNIPGAPILGSDHAAAVRIEQLRFHRSSTRTRRGYAIRACWRCSAR